MALMAPRSRPPAAECAGRGLDIASGCSLHSEDASAWEYS